MNKLIITCMRLHSKVSTIVFMLTLCAFPAFSQIENVVIEKYYISDSLDATDTTMGIALPVGSVTYRVYIDLLPGSKLKSIYGDQNHPLHIKSTAPFYNNVLQPGSNFGYLLNRNLFLSVPTLALDSWLTLGYAAKNQSGVLKSSDTDGNYFAGAINSGGSSMIPGGILVNADPAAGIPLTVSDGMMTNITAPGTWLDDGFKDASGVDTTVFGPQFIGSEFLSYNSFLQQVNGVTGAGPDTTLILVAQLTTAGEISFKLNVEVEQYDGTSTTTVKYVSSGNSVQPGEVVSPLLIYPQECGCTDANYFEYSPAYSCSNPDSCATLVRFGCTDTLACNYDPHSNFNIPELCCYPGLCQDRDLALVCPELSALRYAKTELLYPNPATDILHLNFNVVNSITLSYTIHDLLGNEVLKHFTGSVSAGRFTDQLDIQHLPPGIYILRINTGLNLETRKFTINR